MSTVQAANEELTNPRPRAPATDDGGLVYRAKVTLWKMRNAAKRAREFVATATIAGVTSITPPAVDVPVTRVLHRWFIRARPTKVARVAGRIEAVLGDGDRKHPSERSIQAARDYWRARIEVRYGEARGSGLRGWKPKVSIDGLTHIDDALARGHGVILWRVSFTSATVVNWAMFSEGHRMVHLSSENHRRANSSWWTRRVAAPFYTRSEAMWLDRRVIRPANDNLSYLRELKEALAANEIVTIVGDLTGALHTEQQKIGNADRKIPTGAPSLAYATGASLHVCIPVREGPFRYRLVIGPDLEVSSMGTKREARRRATAAFAAVVEQNLREHPDSSMWWGRR